MALSAAEVALLGIILTGTFSAGTAAVGPLMSALVDRQKRPKVLDPAALAALKAELKAELEAELAAGPKP
jgi:hypothetical protein